MNPMSSLSKNLLSRGKPYSDPGQPTEGFHHLVLQPENVLKKFGHRILTQCLCRENVQHHPRSAPRYLFCINSLSTILYPYSSYNC
ncbi:hypothetical protein L9F63_027972, partial [Diploptera punctata]